VRWFLFVPLSLLLLVVSIPIQGFVLCKLWDWFVITAFPVPPLSVLHASGLSLTVRYFTARDSKEYAGNVADMEMADMRKALSGAWSYAFTKPAVFFLGGWILSLCV